MFSNNSSKRPAKHLTKKVAKITMQAAAEVNKKSCSRDQNKLEKKLSTQQKNEDISGIERMGKALQKHQHTMKTGKPCNKTSDELSMYLRCASKCETCLKEDSEDIKNILSKEKLKNDICSLACLLKDYIVVNNYLPEKIYDLQKLNCPPQMSSQEKIEMSKLFELIFSSKTKSANDATKKEFQFSGENLKTHEICEENNGMLNDKMTQLEQLDTLQEPVSEVKHGKANDDKCLTQNICGEKHEVGDGMNLNIEVIMPPDLTKNGKAVNLDDQKAPEVNLEEEENFGVAKEYSRFLNSYARKRKENYEITASSKLKHKSFNSLINKDGHQIYDRNQPETKSSYIAASHYGSQKLSHLRSRLLKKLCKSRNIPEILKYKLYLAKLPARVALSNIYPYIGDEIQSLKLEKEKINTIHNEVKKTHVKSFRNLSHNSYENLLQEVKTLKESICPMDHSVTEIVIGDIGEEELSNFFGRERKNKFERFCEFIKSQNHINEHKSCSMLYLFEKLCNNKSSPSKLKGSDDKDDNHKICLRKSHSVETILPQRKPKIKLEVHIPRVPNNYDEPTEETKKQNESLSRGSNTQIHEKQHGCSEEKTFGVSQMGEFKKQEEKSPSLQQPISNKIKIEESKGKPNAALSKISKRTKITGKGKNTVLTPRIYKRNQIINEKFYPNINQIKDEKYWKNEFYKRLKCISQKGITENDSMSKILNHVVSVIKFHWGGCLLNG